MKPSQASEITIPQEIAILMSPQQLRVLKYKLDGLTYDQIAKKMHIRPYTVRDYVGVINKKFRIAGQNKIMAYILPDLTNAQLKQMGKTYGLTARETDVLGCTLSGLSLTETGKALDISFQTVKNHRKEISRKMNVHSPNDVYQLAKKFLVENFQGNCAQISPDVKTSGSDCLVQRPIFPEQRVDVVELSNG